MKPTVTTKIDHQLARQDLRAGRRHAFPLTDHFFRPEAERSQVLAQTAQG
jgi:hypothetical protein